MSELREFDLAWLPKGLPPQITAFRRGNRVGLDIDTIVGTIPLRNGDTLQIRPKAGSANFLRMLLEAEVGDSAPVQKLDGLAGYQSSDELALAALVARPFVSLLKELESSSLRFGWQRKIERSDTVAGDLILLDTVVGLRTRSEQPFTYQKKQRTYDTAENRVLKAASAIITKKYQRLLSPDDRRFVQKFLDRFDFGPITIRDIETIKANLSMAAYSGARYYEAPLKLALIILAQGGFRQGDNEHIRAEPILFNSADIFEKYVRMAIMRHYQKLGLTVRKGFFPPRSLFKDGTITLEPDVVLMREDSIRLIADVKYKLGGVTPSDAYQAHAYAKRAGVDFAIFFCAADSNLSQLTHRVSHLGISLYEMFLPLSDLDDTARHLSQIERSVPAFRPY